MKRTFIQNQEENKLFAFGVGGYDSIHVIKNLGITTFKIVNSTSGDNHIIAFYNDENKALKIHEDLLHYMAFEDNIGYFRMPKEDQI